MKIAASVLSVLMTGALGGSALAEDAAGHWIGKVTTPGAVLTIVAHIGKGANGALEGYAESPDQVLTPIPLSDIKATPDSFSFVAPSVNGRFSGRWDPAAKAWVGALSQNGFDMPLSLARGVPPPRPVVAGLDGEWSGTIQAPQGDLRMLLHVKTDKDGTLALFESPDQSPMQLVAVVTHVGDAMTVELKGVGGFDGKLSADGKVAEGHWRQSGGSIPLTLKRGG